MGGVCVSGGGVAAESPRIALTERQLDVMRLVAQGLSNQEIADTLMISERTVRTHVSDVLGNLQVASRTAALVALGWVRIPPPQDGPLYVPVKAQSLEVLRGVLLEGLTHLDDAMGVRSEVG